MERLTIPDVILDRGVIQISIIDVEKVKECAMELYWRLKAVEDAIADKESEEYDLNRLRELVEADRDGRCVVLLSDDDVYTIRGDIVNGIIKANCRDACKPPRPR